MNKWKIGVVDLLTLLIALAALFLAATSFAQEVKNGQKFIRSTNRIVAIEDTIDAVPYVIEKGKRGWISSIAKRQYGDIKEWTALCANNRIPDPDSVFAGETIYVPTKPVMAYWMKLPDGKVVRGVMAPGSSDGGGLIRKEEESRAEIETESDSTVQEEQEKSDKVFHINGSRNQIFEGCTFNGCTFNFFNISETETKSDNDSMVTEFDPDGWYLGMMGGSNMKGIQEGYGYISYRNGPVQCYVGASPIMKRSAEFSNEQSMPVVVGGNLFPTNWCAIGARSAWHVLIERAQYTEWWMCVDLRFQMSKPVKGFVPYSQVEYGRDLINHDESAGFQDETIWETRVFIGIEYRLGRGGRK